MADVVEKLEIALQCQVDHDLNIPKEYVELLVAAMSPLRYKSLEELRVILSKGVLLNEGKTWFSLNKNGEHCEMISATDCLIPEKNRDYTYLNKPKYNSRFAPPLYESYMGTYKTRVRPRFLSPNVTYIVNLVFKFSRKEKTFSKLRYIGLRYRLEGEMKSSTKYFADEREDGWVMLELYQFTSDGKTIDLKIQFESSKYYYPSTIIEGIEFRPLEKVEHEVLEDDDVDMQPTSDSDLDWEQNLPNDYEEIVKWSEDGVQWTTKKELYFLLCKGFLIKNDIEWFFLSKKGKKCYMLPAGAALINSHWSWRSLPESRFNLEAYNPIKKCIRIECNIKTRILSPQETYACYLVYKLSEDHSDFEAPLKVRDKDFDKEDWDNINYNHEKLRKEGWEETDYWFIFLVSPPETPVIGQKVDQISNNRPLNKSKLKGLPILRSDGWMEVKVWEFETRSSLEMISTRVDLVSAINILLKGLIVQGIEFKAISS